MLNRLVLAAALLGGLLHADLASAQSNVVGSPNTQIMSLARAKVPDAVIIAYIRSNPAGLDKSSDAIIALNSAGVSSEVLAALYEQASQRPRDESLPRDSTPSTETSPAIQGVSSLTASQKIAAEQRDFAAALQNYAVFTYVGGVKVELTPDTFTIGSAMASGTSFLYSMLGAEDGISAMIFEGKRASVRLPKEDARFLISFPAQRMPDDNTIIVAKLSFPALSNNRGLNRATSLVQRGGSLSDGGSSSLGIERSKLVPVTFVKSDESVSLRPEMQTLEMRFSSQISPGEYVVIYANHLFTFGVD